MKLNNKETNGSNIQSKNEFVVDSASQFMKKYIPDAMIESMSDEQFDEFVKITIKINPRD